MYFNRGQIRNEHYKMYKAGKKWIVGSTVLMGLTVGLSFEQPHPVLAATVSPQEEVPKDVSAQTKTSDLADPAAETVEEETDTLTTEPKLADTYDEAQKQVDDANGKSDAVNASQAKLQALLNQADLTSQKDWQMTLQAALDDYQKNASDFNNSTTKTQELIAVYQAKINATVKEQPNAVKQVTDAKTTGTSLADYQRLTTNFQRQVTEQVQAVQTNLDNYAVSAQVNQLSADLTAAATKLNTGLQNPTLTSTDLLQLKNIYNQSVIAYNSAVIAYNDKSGEKLATISENDMPDLTPVLTNRQIQATHDTTVEKYQVVQDDLTDYQAAVKKWQDAVTAYNAALKSLTLPDEVDRSELQTTQQAVTDTVNQLAKDQAAYNAVMLNPDNQAILSAYLDAAKNNPTEFAAEAQAQDTYIKRKAALAKAQADLSSAQSDGRITAYFETQVATAETALAEAAEAMAAAEKIVAEITTPLKLAYDTLLQNKDAVIQPVNRDLTALQEQLKVWQSTYQDYRTAVATANTTALVVADFEALATVVQSAQTNVDQTLKQLVASQKDYQKALADYQTALTASGQETKASDAELPELDALQTALTTAFAKNATVMAATPHLVTMLQAESQLQQRIGQINQIIATINSDQAMLKTLYTSAYQGNMWTVLTPIFQSVGHDLAAKAADYQLAIFGSKDEPSYDNLVTSLKEAQAAADSDETTFTYPQDVVEQANTFNDDFTQFMTNYQNFLNYLEQSAPNEKNNAKIVKNMTDGATLSTNGIPTNVELGEVGSTTINVYQYLGDNLTYFVGKSDGTADLYGDRFGSVRTLIIAEDAKTAATSDSGTPYLQVSPNTIAEMTALLHGMITPSFTKDGVNYHIAGVRVPGLGNDQVPRSKTINSLDEFYIFTSIDPIAEFMAMFNGITTNVNLNHNFEFFYTASPKPGVNDNTALSSATTLPALPSLAVADASETWKTGELSTKVPTVAMPAPNEATFVTLPGIHYTGGVTVQTGFGALTVNQAPTITLNHVQETPTTNPGITDPGTPDTGEPAPGTIPDKPSNPDGTPTVPNELDDSATTTQIPDQPTDQGQLAKHPTPVTDGEKGSLDSQVLRTGTNGRVTDKSRNLLTSRQSSAVLPQTGERDQTAATWLGSLLLTLSGLTWMKLRRKKD